MFLNTLKDLKPNTVAKD